MDMLYTLLTAVLTPVQNFVNQPWWLVTLWIIYCFILLLVFRARFADGCLLRYAHAYGNWVDAQAMQQKAIHKARTNLLEAQQDDTQDVDAARAELDLLTSVNLRGNIDSMLRAYTDWWYTRWFKSPRSIALIIVILSILWPVEMVVRPLYWLTRWALGLNVLRTVRAVITLKE